jgi:hypothetical protein
MEGHLLECLYTCFRPVLRIRIRLDPYHIERKDPEPHQSDKLNQEPHLFADDKPKLRCMEYEPI